MKRALIFISFLLLASLTFAQNAVEYGDNIRIKKRNPRLYFNDNAWIGTQGNFGTTILYNGVPLGTGGSVDSSLMATIHYVDSLIAAVQVGSMIWPSSGGIALYDGSGHWSTSITNNSAHWETAYSERNQWDGGATGLVAATGRTSLGMTTVGSNFATMPNPGVISYIQINANNTITAYPLSLYKSALGINNVTNESKATMFSNPTFTGTVYANSIVPTIDGAIIGGSGVGLGHLWMSNGGTIHWGTYSMYAVGGTLIANMGLNLGSGTIYAGVLGSSVARLSAGYFTGLSVTNPIAGSVTGSAGSVTGLNLGTGSYTQNGDDALVITTNGNTSIVVPTGGTIPNTDDVQDIIDANHAAWISEAPAGLVMNDTASLLITYKRLTDSLSALRQLVYTLVGQLDLDIIAPYFSSAEIGTYNDSIIVTKLIGSDTHQDSIPPTTAITVLENGVSFGIAEIKIGHDTLYTALDSTAATAATITIAYTQGIPALQDSTGNKTASWTAHAVTNNVTGGGTGTPPDFYTTAYAWTKAVADSLTLTGTAIDSWLAGAHDFTGTGATKPQWDAANQEIDFAADDDRLSMALSPTGQPISIQMVVRQNSNTDGDNIIFFSESDATRLIQNAAITNMTLYAGEWGVGISNAVGTQYGILTIVLNGANSYLQWNDNTPVTGNAGTGVPLMVSLGLYSDAAAMSVKEIVVYRGAFTTQQIADGKAYLNGEYSIY